MRLKGKAERVLYPLIPPKLKPPKPKRITHSGNETAVEWDDDTKTVVRCMQDDHPDNYAAFCAAVAKRVYGDNGTVKRLWKSAEVTEPEPLKRGDLVRILDGSKIPCYAGGWSSSMGKHIGEMHKVQGAWDGGRRVNLEDVGFTWDYRGLQKIC